LETSLSLDHSLNIHFQESFDLRRLDSSTPWLRLNHQ
jgi:hypothetical protein